MAPDEIVSRLDRDVRGEQHERGGDQLLRAALRVARAHATARHQPQHNEAGAHLDHAVGAEPDQRDRPRDHASADRNRRLQHMPAQTQVRERSCPTRKRPTLRPIAGTSRGSRREGRQGRPGAHP